MNYDKPTASSLERAYECPSSCAIQVRVHSSSGYADAGTDKHAFVEAVLAKHKPIAEALADVPLESRQTCADLDWDTLLDGIDRTTLRIHVTSRPRPPSKRISGASFFGISSPMSG